jgi:hypothetical protein
MENTLLIVGGVQRYSFTQFACKYYNVATAICVRLYDNSRQKTNAISSSRLIENSRPMVSSSADKNRKTKDVQLHTTPAAAADWHQAGRHQWFQSGGTRHRLCPPTLHSRLGVAIRASQNSRGNHWSC